MKSIKSIIQVLSIQVRVIPIGNTHTNIIITYNVKTRDPIGSEKE